MRENFWSVFLFFHEAQKTKAGEHFLHDTGSRARVFPCYGDWVSQSDEMLVRVCIYIKFFFFKKKKDRLYI